MASIFAWRNSASGAKMQWLSFVLLHQMLRPIPSISSAHPDAIEGKGLTLHVGPRPAVSKMFRFGMVAKWLNVPLAVLSRCRPCLEKVALNESRIEKKKDRRGERSTRSLREKCKDFQVLGV